MDEMKLIIEKKQYKGETSVISTRLPIEVIKDLDKIASDTGRTRNDIVQLCLEFAIEKIIIKENKEWKGYEKVFNWMS